MSVTVSPPATRQIAGTPRAFPAAWWVSLGFLAAWLVLFVPVYLDFAARAWLRDENAHAPFLLAICAGLVCAQVRRVGLHFVATQTERLIGIGGVCMTLLAFAYARIQEVEFVLSATQSGIVLFGIIAFFGLRALRHFWMALVLSAYLIIWPGWAIDVLTFPLKMFVSDMVAGLLYAFGLPVTHEGSLLFAGRYELLVADACAGLNSLIALTSIGVVYLYVAQRSSVLSNAIVLAMLIPIAIFSNLIRVSTLVLITYYLGYDAGQSFLHELSGLVMFAAALFGVFIVDDLANAFLPGPSRENRHAEPSLSDRADSPVGSLQIPATLVRTALLIAIAMSVTGVVAEYTVHKLARERDGLLVDVPDLESVLPKTVPGWTEMPLGDAVLPPDSVLERGEAAAYRAYQNSLGRIVTLVIAYGPPAGDTVRLHRPEKCYSAQGFQIEPFDSRHLVLAGGRVPVNRLMATKPPRREAISYWVRAGSDYATSNLEHQLINLRYGLGPGADGVMVRISTPGADKADFALHDAFLEQYMMAASGEARRLLLASPD